MTVHFIGAGPGAADLITVRALNLIKSCPVVLYAGSLVPAEIVAEASDGAHVVDTAPLHLDEIIEEIKSAHEKGQDVARVHSGDPSIYGAIAEQMRRLDELGIDYDVTPGVPAFAAAAALLKRELTLPDISQSIVLTRTSMRSSSMPDGETLENFAKTGATLAVHLSVNNIANVVKQLSPHYGEDCPVAVVYRASWPDQAYVMGTLSNIRTKVKEAGFTRTALILVGHVLGTENFTDSKLYDAAHTHVLRDAKAS
ncbi:MAG: precorrin-4 C(11)-methyltransferase [Magnetovibrio sp.]|nr:precorrin-4 C(11)-methyltransferase [Magnetovibrio sp.]